MLDMLIVQQRQKSLQLYPLTQYASYANDFKSLHPLIDSVGILRIVQNGLYLFKCHYKDMMIIRKK